jgi:hypothetical protein
VVCSSQISLLQLSLLQQIAMAIWIDQLGAKAHGGYNSLL